MSELDFDRSEPPLMPKRELREPTSDAERRIQRLRVRTGNVPLANLSLKQISLYERRLDSKDFPGME